MSAERYEIADTSEIITPALVIFTELLDANIQQMLHVARSAERLRPHCKTHKMAAVTRHELALGIHKHKAATFAEAEMLARAGVSDILLAYNLVGPNIPRAVEFRKRYPDVVFSVTVDHPLPLRQLSDAMTAADQQVIVLLDVDTGQHRTGIPVGDPAATLYTQIHEAPGLVAGGFHVYDGHQHQRNSAEREAAVLAEWQKVRVFRDQLQERGLPVECVVAGGTGSFPIYAALDDPGLECSPGTCVFHDAGYGEAFPDLDYTPAAVLLTRVISRPTPERITLDLGYKAVASDPPAGNRLVFPALPDAKAVLQNEEHLVLETAAAGRYAPGDELVAIPRHICPTSALHKQAWVVSEGRIVDHWPVDARDRWLDV